MSAKPTRPALVHASREVRALLSPADLAKIDIPSGNAYRCLICNKATRLTPQTPANAIALTDGRQVVLALAHPWCAPSEVIGPDQDMATTVWARPSWCQPWAVLLCRPAATLTGLWKRSLQESGFALLTGWEQPFPYLDRLHAHITPRPPADDTSDEPGDPFAARLTVTLPARAGAPPSTLITCPIRSDPIDHRDGPPWYQPALAEGHLGVVVLPGANPTHDTATAINAAIRDRRALAATAHLTADAQTGTHAATTAPAHPLVGTGGPRRHSHYLIERSPNGDTNRTVLAA